MAQRPDVGYGLGVDLYHIDSAYVAWRAGLSAPATFDLYTRSAPFGGAFLLVAGLELALAFVRDFRFGDEEIAYLRSLRPYDEAFLSHLRDLRFTGEIRAIPEGEIAFADEPLARVTAPFSEALLVESGLLHTVGVSTLLATKAARIVLAAEGRTVAEFGYRRAQAPFLAARSAYIGGCASTSFVAAARRYGIPASGTVPHALIEAFDDERAAFRAVAETLPVYSLLLDTYDIERAIHTAVEVARETEERLGHRLGSVRLDSGDLAACARLARRVLDEAGLTAVRVVASGDLDEWRIAALVRAGAPIDGFGVGTSLSTGAGSVEHGVEGGALGAVYKLAWLEGGASPARIKIAGEKSTWPGKKQVARIGAFARDLIQLDDEPIPQNGRPMLRTVMQGGEALDGALPPLAEIRERAAANLAALPAAHRALEAPEEYPVERSAALVAMRERAIAAHTIAGRG
jgi:nicotinate phosphoribosyltransferase